MRRTRSLALLVVICWSLAAPVYAASSDGSGARASVVEQLAPNPNPDPSPSPSPMPPRPPPDGVAGSRPAPPQLAAGALMLLAGWAVLRLIRCRRGLGH